MRMAESGAICQYLTERYGRAPFKRAFGDPDYPAYLQWIHAGEATLAPPLIAIAQHTMMWPEAKRAPHVAVDAADTFRNRLQVLDRALTGRHFLLGSDMSAADVMVGYAFVLAGFFKLMGDAPPHVAAYWRRLQDRPAFQKAMSA